MRVITAGSIFLLPPQLRYWGSRPRKPLPYLASASRYNCCQYRRVRAGTAVRSSSVCACWPVSVFLTEKYDVPYTHGILTYNPSWSTLAHGALFGSASLCASGNSTATAFGLSPCIIDSLFKPCCCQDFISIN